MVAVEHVEAPVAAAADDVAVIDVAPVPVATVGLLDEPLLSRLVQLER